MRHSIALALAVLACIAGAAAGGYEFGRSSRNAVQMSAVNISTGRTHWVSVDRANCGDPASSRYIGRALCSWLGQVRVAP